MDLLPEEIIPTVLCYVVCCGQSGRRTKIWDCKTIEIDKGTGEENEIDIAICNSNGFLIEIFNKKIVNSCYVLIEDAVKLLLYYQFTRESCNSYYLVQNDKGVLIIVKKWQNMLMVVKCYSNVKNCKIFDFENKGYPQVGIYNFESEHVSIINLSEFDNFKLGIDNYFLVNDRESVKLQRTGLTASDENDIVDNYRIMVVDEEELGGKKEKSLLTNYLSKRLQSMENFKDGLKYEIYNLDQMFKNGLKREFFFSTALSETDHFEEINIEITQTWLRIHHCYWLLGIEFWSRGIRDINDVSLVLRSKDFTSCTYRFFNGSETNAKNSVSFRNNDCGEDQRDMKKSDWVISNGPDEGDPKDLKISCAGSKKAEAVERPGVSRNGQYLKSIAVVALEVPEFGKRSKLSVAFTFLCGKNQFHSQTFSLRPEHFLYEEYQVFGGKDEMKLSEDLMACLVIYKEVDLIVEVKYNLGMSLEAILTERLGFIRREILGEDYFIKENGDLRGLSLSIKRIREDSIMWKLKTSVRDVSVLKILTKALYNELPKPARIRLDEKSANESANWEI